MPAVACVDSSAAGSGKRYCSSQHRRLKLQQRLLLLVFIVNFLFSGAAGNVRESTQGDVVLAWFIHAAHYAVNLLSKDASERAASVSYFRWYMCQSMLGALAVHDSTSLRLYDGNAQWHAIRMQSQHISKPIKPNERPVPLCRPPQI